jgi:REP element-mobilizing transposase RayT
MSYNPNNHHRKSIRLKGYDYTQAGLYFITICCQNRECLFGNIINGEMILNDAGNIANECWLAIPNHFPNVVLHEFVIMPNHIHGIIELKTKSVGAENFPPHISMGVNDSMGANDDSPLRSPSKTIGSMVRGYKIGVTKWMRQNTDVYNVWQRNYWEHIIRNENEYNRIAEYIINNPQNWGNDTLKS